MTATTTSQYLSFITIENKRFHYMWLRENCPSCRYAAPYQQLYDRNISDRPANPQPLSVELNAETLTIDWDETPAHRSVFSVKWLLEHSYDPEPELESDCSILWDKVTLTGRSPQPYDFRAINNDDWIEPLFTLGFVVLENIPPDELESFLSSIGPIYNVDYGTIVPLETKDKSAASLPSRDGCALPPHNDLSYWGGHRLTQFLYCVDRQNPGGASILVDGFRVATDFRKDYPQYFQILAETPVQFWLADNMHRYQFCNTATILECDRAGNLTTVRFSSRNCRPQIPFAKLEAFYQAYNSFFLYLKNPDYHYQFHLKTHNCLLFQNFRILHGRTAFDPAIGSRKLSSGYLDWNFFAGRKKDERRFEQGYGEALDIPDTAYGKGAGYSRESLFAWADVIYCIKVPQPKDYQYFRENQTLVGWIHPFGASGNHFRQHCAEPKNLRLFDITNRISIRVIQGTVETLNVPRDITHKNSILAGYASMMQAIMLRGGITNNDKVAIFGGGNVAYGVLKYLANRGIDPLLRRRSIIDLVRQEFADYDIFVNTVEISPGDEPIVTWDMLDSMKSTGWIIDAAADTGRAIQGTRATKIEDPIYQDEKGHTFYVVDNSPSLLYRESSEAVSEGYAKHFWAKPMSYWYSDFCIAH
ncbi:TauD/TfdA family dioxygenase [Roseofilum casamattae]|uniref:TauD/TfdA family dioxygenase n=1 Tax=Roseofilum casamattae BLCC-M143 TaxID=3022442 RepID=A0ABT7BX55_9CYAN|nr:TauD/TfdA family dioxygenase [Roseofilum casamattae]MDJ1183751.1 TauD/TfdA family dioxygenase [Roseofilum casamattae BLCC-M143]